MKKNTRWFIFFAAMIIAACVLLGIGIVRTNKRIEQVKPYWQQNGKLQK